MSNTKHTPQHARYDSHTYFAWLIERRDMPQPMWWTADCCWTVDANKALWFARREDADASANECQHDVFVCKHGFILDAPAKARACNSYDALVAALECYAKTMENGTPNIALAALKAARGEA